MHKLQIWGHTPTDRLTFDGNVVEYVKDFDEELEVGPVRVNVRWNPSAPEMLMGEIYGTTTQARRLVIPHGQMQIIGTIAVSTVVRIEGVSLTQTCEKDGTHVESPYKIAEFIGFRIEVVTRRAAADSFFPPPSALVIVSDHYVWRDLLPSFAFRYDTHTRPSRFELETAVDGFRVVSHPLVIQNPDENARPEHRQPRIAMAFKVSPTDHDNDTQAERLFQESTAIVDDLVLVAGLVARSPLRVMGGVHIRRARESEDEVEYAEYLTVRKTYQPPEANVIHQLQVSGRERVDFLIAGIQCLRTDNRSEFIRLALQSYTASLYPAFITQKFLDICTGIEALKERHARNKRWDKRLNKKERSAVRAHVEEALRNAAAEGVLVGDIYAEARAKIMELFRPRIRTLLIEMIRESQVQVDDLFNRSPIHQQSRHLPPPPNPQGYDFDFLTVRNRLVHQGKPPDDLDYFVNVNYRAMYFLERLLFSVLGHTDVRAIDMQWPIEIEKP